MVEALRTRVDQLGVRLTVGDVDEEAIVALLEDAREAGYAPSIGEARLLLAKKVALVDEGKRAAELYEDAFNDALSGQHLEVQIWAATLLVYIYGAKLRDADAARRWAERAQALLQAHPFPPAAAALENNLGTTAHRQGDSASARRHFERARDLFEDLEGTQFQSIGVMGNLAILTRQEDDLEESSRLFESAIAEVNRLFGPRHPMISRLTVSLASTRRAQGDLDGSQALLVEAVRLIEARDGPEAKQLGHPLNSIARIKMDRGDHAEALPLLDRVIALWTSKDPEDPFLVVVLSDRGEEALSSLERAAELQPSSATAKERAYLLMVRARATADRDPRRGWSLAREASALEVTDPDTLKTLAAWRTSLPRDEEPSSPEDSP